MTVKYEAAHQSECEFPGCASGGMAVHHVFLADFRRQGDMCAFHSPYDIIPGEFDEDDDETEDTPVMQYADGFSFVTVYDTDRAYGGQEEGGWWYDCGSVVLCRQVPSQDAERVRDELREQYPRTGKRYSVIYPGTGDYDVVISDTPGENYPRYTPRYE